MRLGVKTAWIVLAAVCTLCGGAASVLAMEELPLGDAIEIEVTLKEYSFTPDSLAFEMGKLYKLKVHNAGKMRHEFDSPILAASVLTTMVEVVDAQGNIMAAFRGRLVGIELLPGNTVYWWFMPTKPQEKPREFICDEPGHLKRGMHGTFTIR